MNGFKISWVSGLTFTTHMSPYELFHSIRDSNNWNGNQYQFMNYLTGKQGHNC